MMCLLSIVPKYLNVLKLFYYIGKDSRYLDFCFLIEFEFMSCKLFKYLGSSGHRKE